MIEDALKIDLNNIFPTIIGQFPVRAHLYQAMESDRLAHALLFVGPSGVGKTAFALELARVVNCNHPPLESAQLHCQCDSCRWIDKLAHPNLSILFPLPPAKTEKEKEEAYKVYLEQVAIKAQNPYSAIEYKGSGQILVDHVRELRNELSLSQDRQGIRVAIIQPADRMNANASNALLKILEEPPKKCMIILIAPTLRSLLPTILSRCQIIRFIPLTVDEIKSALIEREEIDIDRADKIARLANGSYAKALMFLDETLTDLLEQSIEFLRRSVTGDTEKLAPLIEHWVRGSGRQALIEKLEFISIWIRDAVLRASFSEEEVQPFLATSGKDKIIDRIAKGFTQDQLCRVWQEIEEAKLAIESNVMGQLALTALSVQINRIMK